MQSIGKKSRVLTFRNVLSDCVSGIIWYVILMFAKKRFFKAYFGAFKHVGFAMFHSSKCGLGNLSSRGQSLE